MKKNIKKILIVIIVLVIAYTGGCHMPFVARYIQHKIRPEMSANEVRNTLKSQKFGRYHDSCSIIINGEEKVYFSSCEEKINTLSAENADFIAKMHITFMGPAFTHNDFEITFNRKGKVESVSPVKHWD